MLKSLLIKNYALIDELNVQFSGGLVIITGETGAGKSIIIDALGLVIGERAHTEMIRTGAEKAIVEAVLDISGNRKVSDLLRNNDIESSDELILRREVSAKGQSRCFLNDTPSSATVLKQVGDMLVDLHGQHEHQSLLRAETHIGMLDEFGGLDGMVGEFQKSYARLRDLSHHLSELRRREESPCRSPRRYPLAPCSNASARRPA